MAFVVHANLDCESTWSGLPLSPAVTQRISLYGALVSVLAPDDVDVELWTPAAIDPARWLGPTKPAFRTGVPEHADLAWADPSARAANDRRLAQSVVTLPGAKTITRVDELAIHGPWIAKAPWSAAGRDRCRGAGPPTEEQRTRLGRLLATCGALVVEPWCDRILDVAVCAAIDASGTVTTKPPHGLLTDVRGGFVGIDLAGAALEPHEHAQLEATVALAGAALAKIGFAGRFAIDAFAYRDGDVRRFHPLCEINARTTFGWIAWALAARCRTTRLGFASPPQDATVLIAPATDQVTAWIA